MEEGRMHGRREGQAGRESRRGGVNEWM